MESNFNILKKVHDRREVFEEIRKLAKTDPILQKEMLCGISNQIELETHMKIWGKNLYKTFVLSNDLVEAFLNTDLPKDIRVSDLRIPYKSFMIENGKGLLKCLVKGFENTTSLMPVHNILVTSVEALLEQVKVPDPSKLKWNLWMIGVIPTTKSPMIFETISACLDKDDLLYSFREPSQGLDNLEGNEQRQLMNMVGNTILYINDPKRSKDTESSRKRTMLSGEIKSNKKKIKVEHEFIYLKTPTNYTSISSGTGNKLEARITVRGHWRNQACGVGYQDHKYIWIAPFWKGPSTSEIISKTYRVL